MRKTPRGGHETEISVGPGGKKARKPQSKKPKSQDPKTRKYNKKINIQETVRKELLWAR